MSLKLLEKYWQHLKKYENVIIISYYSQNIVWFRFKMFAIFPTVPAAFRNFNRWLCSCLLPQQKKELKSGANRWQTAALGGHLLIMSAWSALLFKVKSECWLATTTSSLPKSFVWRRLFRSFLSPAKNSQWENTFVAINRPLAGNSCSCWSRAALYPLQTSFICWLFIYFIFFFLYFIRRQSQENPTTFFSAHFQCESSLHSSGTPADGHMVFVRHQRPTNSQLSSRLEQVRTSLLLEFIFETLYKSFVRAV